MNSSFTTFIQKRIVVGVMVAAMLFGMAPFAPHANAQLRASEQSVPALLAQIEQLMELITSLKSQLAEKNAVSPEGGFEEKGIARGVRVETTDVLKVRAGASMNSVLQGTVPAGTGATVLLGPIEANGYTWWRLQYDTGLTGWSAENWLRSTESASSPVTNSGSASSNLARYSVQPKVARIDAGANNVEIATVKLEAASELRYLNGVAMTLRNEKGTDTALETFEEMTVTIAGKSYKIDLEETLYAGSGLQEYTFILFDRDANGGNGIPIPARATLEVSVAFDVADSAATDVWSAFIPERGLWYWSRSTGNVREAKSTNDTVQFAIIGDEEDDTDEDDIYDEEDDNDEEDDDFDANTDAAVSNWTAKSFTIGGSTSTQCDGSTYVGYSEKYELWVGAQLCGSADKYKLYMSTSKSGTYYQIADYGGHGQDHCELVNEDFTIPNEDSMNSGTCSDCTVGSGTDPIGETVFARSRFGQQFEKVESRYWGDLSTNYYQCSVSIGTEEDSVSSDDVTTEEFWSVTSRTQIYMAGAYEGSYPDGDRHSFGYHPQGEVQVNVPSSGGLLDDTLLILTSYEPVNWKLSGDGIDRINRVFLSGYYDQEVSGIPDDVEVFHLSHESGDREYFYFYQNNSTNLTKLVDYLEDKTGVRPYPLHAEYSLEEITLSWKG